MQILSSSQYTGRTSQVTLRQLQLVISLMGMYIKKVPFVLHNDSTSTSPRVRLQKPKTLHRQSSRDEYVCIQVLYQFISRYNLILHTEWHVLIYIIIKQNHDLFKLYYITSIVSKVNWKIPMEEKVTLTMLPFLFGAGLNQHTIIDTH